MLVLPPGSPQTFTPLSLVLMEESEEESQEDLCLCYLQEAPRHSHPCH